MHRIDLTELRRLRFSWVVLLAISFLTGCSPERSTSLDSSGGVQPGESPEPTVTLMDPVPNVAPEPSPDTAAAQGDTAAESKPTFQPVTYSATAEQLLAARLSADESAAGWVRLFDGHTLFGWEITGQANFRVEDGTIVVDQGEPCLLCTSTTWGDFELTLEFNADEGTNSGVFVRTPIVPENVTEACYEINIAPDDNPFPTASLVQRKKVDAEAAGDQTPGQWRTMTIRAEGKQVETFLDGNSVCQYTDERVVAPQRIGLQHNSGRVRFRNIKVRPLGLAEMLDTELTQWKKYPEMPGDFTVNEHGDLHVTGGRTQLETNESYGDFLLFGQYKIDQSGTNSGIFFRCIPGDVMMGYECQVNNDFQDDSRLSPVDCGTGGIFRRQDARVVAGDNGQWVSLLLHAHANKFSAWVEGVQVSDWEDTRELHENPRKGKRLDAGTIMIQGHDPGTDLLFRNLKIVALP